MIYFIQDVASKHVKIGVAKDPWKRLDNLQIGAPGLLQLIGLIEGELADERALRARFAHLHVRGEWFSATAELAAFLRSVPTPLRAKRIKDSEVFWNGKNDAEVASLVGLDRVMVHRIRHGDRRPSPEKAILLQRVTGVSALRLIFGDDADEAFAGFTNASERVA